MALHPWHDIPLGGDPADGLTAVIEVPRKSTIKYELCKDTGLIRISHVLYPPVPYPGNYGFFPQTLDADGDPLDMMVIMRDAVAPLTLCDVRPIGVVEMTDGGKNDDKVLCVLRRDPIYDPYQDFEGLPAYERDELQWFFTEYQKTSHDALEVKGISGRDAAHRVIRRCVKNYLDAFGDRSDRAHGDDEEE